MSKHKHYPKKSTKCPEPFNTLLNWGAGFTMSIIADKMEDKYHYRKHGVPNPYRASAYAMSLGRLNTVEQTIRLGAVLGAMGSFDVDCDSPPPRRKRRIPTYWEFDDIAFDYSYTNDNRYAWRLNCEDGSEYGIFPEDYETREEYNEAIQDAQNGVVNGCTDEFPEGNGEDIPESFDVPDGEELIFCKVSRLDNGANQYYRSDDFQLKVGDLVYVPNEAGTAVKGVILSVERFTRATASQDPEQTAAIIGIACI